ncbi:MAG: hypothetical protein R3F24_11825 [Gammaproteobacteria bacterium]
MNLKLPWAIVGIAPVRAVEDGFGETKLSRERAKRVRNLGVARRCI